MERIILKKNLETKSRQTPNIRQKYKNPRAFGFINLGYNLYADSMLCTVYYSKCNQVIFDRFVF